MKVPISWLKDFVDIDVSIDEFVDRMTMTGTKVETVEKLGANISNVVVGHILERRKHPNADRLQICQVDVGNNIVQIITAADNIETGDYIPVALHGAELADGTKIKRGKLRGEVSEGMMCSGKELGLTEEDYPGAETHGILVLDRPYVPGTDIKEALGLAETVIDFEITPNRPDCLSVMGIGREAAATFKKPFRSLNPIVKEDEQKASDVASVEIECPELCPRYAARVIKNVKIGPSPKWMRDRLQAAGMRPINNVVDITNYVMLECGQPLHAFDINMLEDHKIVVRRARDGEDFETLDGVIRKLDNGMLVITDGVKPVALAGIMGGANSEINDDTKTVLLESANFDKVCVRRASRKLGLRTEASSRFEKGLDPELAMLALNRAAELFNQLEAGMPLSGVIDVYSIKPETRVIHVRVDRINALLGIDISAQEMKDILLPLGFNVEREGDMLAIEVPSFRQDVCEMADIAEEIARFYGYDKIEPTLMKSGVSVGGRNQRQQLTEYIKDILTACGLYEINTYSFMGYKQLKQAGIELDDAFKPVVIKNALGEDQSLMRSTLVPSMLETLARNINRGTDSFAAFEIAPVFLTKELIPVELPEQPMRLIMGMYGEYDFFNIKGILEVLLDALAIKEVAFRPVYRQGFHPGRAAEIRLGDNILGVVGEIHPDVLENFEIEKRVYISDIDMELLLSKGTLERTYVPLPKFPAVERDMAVVVTKDILSAQIEDVIKENGGRLIEEIKLFDVYEGAQIPPGYKSMAYSIVYRASDRTRTDKEVDKLQQRIVKALSEKLGAQLRG